MKRTSIFAKIFLGHVLIIVLLSGFTLIFSLVTVRNYINRTVSADAKKLSKAVSPSISNVLKTANKESDFFPLVERLSENLRARISIIGTNGNIIADSDLSPNFWTDQLMHPEIINALSGEISEDIRITSPFNKKMLYVAKPMYRDGEISAVLRLGIILSDIDFLLQELEGKILIATFLMILLSLIFAIMLSNHISRPLRDLAYMAREVASGNFETKIFMSNRDEIKDLADSFNNMIGQIKDLFDEISYQKEELVAIMESLNEKLVVLSEDGRVILYNNSFKDLLKKNTYIGKNTYYWDIIREPALYEVIKKTKDKGADESFAEEVILGDSVFTCSVTPIRHRKEFVFVLHDITEIKSLAKVKKLFVDNVSHELRTPLTSIKGFAETLSAELSGKGKHFVEIINKNTDRLIHIVEDLLVLSELEEENIKIEFEKIDLDSICKNVTKIFEKKLSDKKIKMKYKIEKDVPLVKGDPFKIEQVVINLVDNAIKYTEKGQVNISLSKANEDGKDFALIKISDTGIGIPKEDLDRVFDRFYVVDKSRSRKVGGTGLGLSIVKHIVQLHGGSLHVESSVSKGTDVSVYIPSL